MRALREIRVGVRSPATIVFLLIPLWFLSVWLGIHAGKGFVSSLSLFWGAVFMFVPFIAPIFAAVALFLHFRDGRRHPFWAYTALVVSLLPWFLYLVFWIWSL